MLDNLLTEADLIIKYEVLNKWFDYGSQNHIESIIGLDITRKHMQGCKSSPEYNMRLREVNNYYSSFTKSLGLDMPVMIYKDFDEVQAV